MKKSYRVLLTLFLLFFVLYLGGWRVVSSSQTVHEKVNMALEEAQYDSKTQITERFIANADLNVYIYSSDDGGHFGLMNLYEKKYGDGSVILALLIVAIPFGVLII